MTDSPDEVVVHAPEVCVGCGGDLAGAEVTGVERRQVTDVAVVKPTVTEHRREERRCACCGTVTVGAFPIASAAHLGQVHRIRRRLRRRSRCRLSLPSTRPQLLRDGEPS
jgi:transposase